MLRLSAPPKKRDLIASASMMKREDEADSVFYAKPDPIRQRHVAAGSLGLPTGFCECPRMKERMQWQKFSPFSTTIP